MHSEEFLLSENNYYFNNFSISFNGKILAIFIAIVFFNAPFIAGKHLSS